MEPLNKSAIAILGGEGFIGRNLADYLSDQYECFSIGETKSLFPGRNDTFISAHPYKEKMNNHYDVIIHLIDNQRCAPEDFLSEEKKLVENLSLNDTNHFILFSSAVIYANPASEYGVRKTHLEDFYLQYCKKNNIKLTILRLFNTFGPFQIPYKQGSLVANVIYNHLIGREIEIYDRNSKRDFLYGGDIPRLVAYVLKEKLSGIFDLGSGTLTSVGDILSILETDVLKTPLHITEKNKTDSIVSPAAHHFLPAMASLTEISKALFQTVDFYRYNIETVKRYVN